MPPTGGRGIERLDLRPDPRRERREPDTDVVERHRIAAADSDIAGDRVIAAEQIAQQSSDALEAARGLGGARVEDRHRGALIESTEDLAQERFTAIPGGDRFAMVGPEGRPGERAMAEPTPPGTFLRPPGGR